MEKRFRGATMREVLLNVREEVGRDAIIIEQRQIAEGVELVVSLDEPGVKMQESGYAGLDLHYVAKLEGLGFSEKFIRRLPSPLPDWKSIRQAMLAAIPTRILQRPLTGIYRLIGAQGVGKSSTAIKLISERALRTGSQGCKLITTDAQRLAGQEALNLAVDLLGISLQVVSKPELLEFALQDVNETDLVVIDTAGMSADEIHRLLPAENPNIKDLLVLPSTWKGTLVKRYVSQLKDRSLFGAVVTHAELGIGLGETLSVLSEFKLPLCWLGTGADLPDTLEDPEADLLLDLIFRNLTVERS